ncbi:MAG: AsmA family protein, partial [Geobacter sp.]|nr:AsmA family protein [Geobacter sp.]
MLPVRRLLKMLLLLLLGAVALLAVAYFVILKVVDLDTYKEQILAQLQETLKRPVSYATGRLSFSYGPAFSFDKLEIGEPDGTEKFISVERFTCRLDILPLLRKQIAIHGLVAEKPLIRLERKADGKFNFSDLLEAKAGGNKIGGIKVRNGNITVIDRAVQQEPLVTQLQKVDLSLEHLGRGKRNHIKLSAALGNGTGGSVTLSGKLNLSPESQPLTDSTLDAVLSTKGVDAGHFWPYYGSKMPFKKLLGSFSTDSELKGKLADFKASGKMSATSVKFDYQPIFKAPLTPKNIKVKYSLEVNPRDVNINAVEVNIDGAEIKGSCAIRDYRSSDPRITAQAVSNEMNFSRFHQYIPYGIIVKHVAAWIEQHIQGGNYKLLDGRLDGRVSQILHMEKEPNYNVLFINARVEKGVVSYGSSVPTFNNIQGSLELKGKDFSLHGMSGNFGSAPLTLEGKITDYPLDSPSAYPFKMAISPGRQEIALLLGKETASRFSYSGSSALHLAGEGFFTGYKLSGDWNLTPAAFSYADLLAKPVGTAASISFRSTLTPAETTLNSARCNLATLSLDLSGKYPFASNKGLDIAINSNSFPAETIASMSQRLGKYQPSGRAQLSVRGTQPDKSKDMRWQGSAALSNASVRFSPTAQPVSAITGNISFDENSMESSQLSARVG